MLPFVYLYIYLFVVWLVSAFIFISAVITGYGRECAESTCARVDEVWHPRMLYSYLFYY